MTKSRAAARVLPMSPEEEGDAGATDENGYMERGTGGRKWGRHRRGVLAWMSK
jgi:hypothetical protein